MFMIGQKVKHRDYDDVFYIVSIVSYKNKKLIECIGAGKTYRICDDEDAFTLVQDKTPEDDCLKKFSDGDSVHTDAESTYIILKKIDGLFQTNRTLYEFSSLIAAKNAAYQLVKCEEGQFLIFKAIAVAENVGIRIDDL